MLFLDLIFPRDLLLPSAHHAAASAGAADYAAGGSKNDGSSSAHQRGFVFRLLREIARLWNYLQSKCRSPLLSSDLFYMLAVYRLYCIYL